MSEHKYEEPAWEAMPDENARMVVWEVQQGDCPLGRVAHVYGVDEAEAERRARLMAASREMSRLLQRAVVDRIDDAWLKAVRKLLRSIDGKVKKAKGGRS